MLFKKTCKNRFTFSQIMDGFAFICLHVFAVTNNISGKYKGAIELTRRSVPQVAVQKWRNRAPSPLPTHTQKEDKNKTQTHIFT